MPLTFRCIVSSLWVWRLSPVWKETQWENRLLAMIPVVSTTIATTLDHPMPRRANRVQYFAFGANLHKVTASLLLTGIFIYVVCFSIWSFSSLHTSWDIRSFSFHHASSHCSMFNLSYHARFHGRYLTIPVQTIFNFMLGHTEDQKHNG